MTTHPVVAVSPDVTARAIVIYDGECGMCNRSVRFMLLNDSAAVLRFAPRQSEVGQALLQRHGFEDAAPNSVVLIEGDRVSTRSTAVLRIAGYLRLPWKLGAVLLVLPRAFRDIVYDWVARNRYRWSRPAPSCPLPTEEQRRRFL